MEPVEPTSVVDHSPRLDEDEDLRRRFDDVMGEPLVPLEPIEPPVDLRAYLLDPPPTPEQAERIERRRLLVRRVSLGVTAIIAVLLLAPWPRTDTSNLPSDLPEPSAEVVTVPPAPIRVDIPRRAAHHPRPPRPRQRLVATPTTNPKPTEQGCVTCGSEGGLDAQQSAPSASGPTANLGPGVLVPVI